MAAPIRYVEMEGIDRVKWDRLIHASSNGTPYALSAYLDFAASKWGGLVEGDYEHVMPLPYAKKHGICFIHQPQYIAQLGLIGPDITPERLRSFLEAIPSRFRYIDFSLNPSNLIPLPGFPLRQRNNYVLDLNKDIESLRAQYRENHLRNLKRAAKYGLIFRTGLCKPDSLNRFANGLRSERIDSMIYGVEAKDGQLLASCVLVRFKVRLYYVAVDNHPNGRTLGASHMLIDGIIEHFSHQPLVLDFEGSDVSSLAFFYSGFGARLEPYAALKWNRLPFWLKWFIKD